MKYEQLAKEIIKNVGGRENINSVTHCITRLRFKLKYEEKANTEILKNMDGVVTVIQSAGQYQVVIGNHVADVYQALISNGEIVSEYSDGGTKEKVNPINKLIDIISGVFAPALGVLAATGMIKGFNALFIALRWITPESGTYNILQALGDSLFYFFPIFLGYTASKKFKLNHFVGMAIGAALVHPSLLGLTTGTPLYTLFQGTAIESNVYITFLGIPVILMSYSSSVIPIIFATYVAAKIEKLFNKLIPEVVKTFLVPFFTLLVIVPLTFIVIGPISTWTGQLLGALILKIYDLSPIIAGAFMGGFWQVFVIFGLHWGFIPIAINNLSVFNYDTLLPLILGASFAQVGVVLAILIKTKNKKLKTLSISAFISGIFGVTEPAIYGITLPKKRPFILSCIAGAVGGSITGFTNTKEYMIGGLGIFAIPSHINPETGLDRGFYGALLSMLVSFLVGFALMIIFGFNDEKTSKQEIKGIDDIKENLLIKQEVIVSPLRGEIKALSEVKDEAFSKGILGKGIAIEPKEGQVFSLADGVLTTFFKTGHAIGITTEGGAEVLIHVGMDTVQLEGKYFTPRAKQGDKIKKGDLLLEFDKNAIEEAGYSLITPVVVTNSDNYLDIIETDKRSITYGEELLKIIV